MYKKFVTILTIIAVALSAILPVQLFADNNIGYEGRICRDLGILKGNTGIVDKDYLETRPSRLQAAIMFLRLKGLEQDALSYDRGDNFKDAGVIAWKEGRNVLSYLKDHPQLGWIGDGVNFMPYSLIDSRAYYKVLLESLGYKQKIDGDGDFDWSSVLEFAENKGLHKVAGIKNFTVESLAIATVEALKTKMKGSGKKLIEHLVDIGDVDRKEAISVGLYSKDLEAEVKVVRAISNSKVEVVFEEAVDGSDAAEEDLYDIRHLDIKDVTVKNASTVIIDTSAMSDSITYTLVFNDKNYSFRGLKKDGYAPKLIKAECKDTDLVELSFDRVLDNETAQDTGTYSISGADIKAAELDSTNTKVRLITSGIQAGRSYEIKVHDIKNGDGVKTKLITKRFTGKKDTTPPKLSKLTVLNNVRLLLEFSDSNGLDKASAQDEDNYRITQSGGSLDVIEAKAKDRDDDGLWDSVELVTESQEPGRAYTLIIEDISDASVLENKITREIKKEFRGKSKDKTAPTVARNPKAVTDTMVEIEFSDANALDIQSACDIDNYDMDEDLEIREIKIKDPNNLYSEKGRTVILITSEMEKSESYTLVIRGIADEFGNEMKTSSSAKKYRFKGAAKDRTPPYITSVECIDSRTIELNFDNALDEESAENIANYRINGLALVTKAVLKDGDKTVRLTVSSLPSDRSHTVLLNNIKDLSGNALSNVSVSVLYGGSLYDDDPPEVAYIDAVNKNEVWIHFEEEVYAESAVMMASGVKFKQVGSVLDDGTTVVMKSPVPMDDDEEYEVTKLTGVWDLRNNAYELESNLDFYGTDIENDPPEVDYWDQMDVRRFRVVFTEPVLIAGSGVSGIKNPSGVSINWTAVLNPDEEDTNEAYSTVDYIASKDIPADKEFKFDFTEMVSDYVGLGAYDEDDDDHGDSGSTILESHMEDDEEPYIEYVEAITRCKVQIVFSEAMRLPGRYEITYEDDNNREKTIDIELVEVDSKDNTKVNIFTEDQMSDEYIYVLEPKSAAADIAGNKLDIDDLEIEFAGTNIMSSDYIQGVEILNAYTLKVSKSSRIDNVKSLYELDEDGDVIKEDLIESKSRVSDNVYKIISTKPLLRDVRYKITVDGLDYKFYGGVANGDLELKLPEREITYDGMDFKEHCIEGYRANGDRLDIDEKDDYFKIDSRESLRNGELLYLYVIWDGEIIYGTRVKVEGMPKASSSKEITSFRIKDIESQVEIDDTNNVIALKLPRGTDLKKLTPIIETSPDAMVSPESEVEKDFSCPLIYKVTAVDGSTRKYTINASVLQSSENSITSFKFEGIKAYETNIVEGSKNTILIKVPYNTDIKKLTPILTLSDGAEVTPQSGLEMDFSDPVEYTVTAENGSLRSYKVTVTVAPNHEKLIKEFGFTVPAAAGIIDEAAKSISVKVPFGTDVTKLAAIFSCSDNSTVEVNGIAQKSGDTENNFSGDVIYTVVAQDGSIQNYTVTVSAADADEKKMVEFSFKVDSTIVKAAINDTNHEISAAVPAGTDLTNIAANFIYIGKSVYVGEVQQFSGITTNDFTKPIVYTIVAPDDTMAEYSVIVNK